MTAARRYFFLPVLLSLFAILGIFMRVWPLLVREHPHTVEVNWYNKQAFRGIYRLPHRQYLNITFTGDTALDSKKLAFGHAFIKNMLHSKDSVHAINFHFGTGCSYATFVAAYDICFIEDVPVFIPSDEGLKVLFTTPSDLHRIIKKQPRPLTYL